MDNPESRSDDLTVPVRYSFESRQSASFLGLGEKRSKQYNLPLQCAYVGRVELITDTVAVSLESHSRMTPLTPRRGFAV